MGTKTWNLTIVPCIEKRKRKHIHTKMFASLPLRHKDSNTATTHDVCPYCFSFQKLADPHIAGPFTRMTSSPLTVPTVLNKAQACFSVGVPLLHWDLYEKGEWEDLCTKLVMAKIWEYCLTPLLTSNRDELNHYSNIFSYHCLMLVCKAEGGDGFYSKPACKRLYVNEYNIIL